MDKVNKKKMLLAIFACILIIGCLLLPMTRPMVKQGLVRYVIDAGHGLPDGGAVAPDGTTEQELTLAIAQDLFSCFPSGTAVLTRDGATGLWQEESTIREKKIVDMRARVELVNQHKNATLISIHMNTFSDEDVYGCQVFYRSGDDESLSLARAIQEKINTTFQPENTKVCKPIPDNLYLFKNVENPSVLIECGFLTNADDLKNLKDTQYRDKFTKVIFSVLQS